MKEHIRHVLHTHADKKGLTWCGVQEIGFSFESIDHAAYERLRDGRLEICKACREQIIWALNS